MIRSARPQSPVTTLHRSVRRSACRSICLACLGIVALSCEPRWRIPNDLPPADEVSAPCAAALAPVSSSGRVALVDLAVAHADMRMFLLTAGWPFIDQALSAALEPESALTDIAATLAAYAAALPEVCVLAVDERPLGPGSIAMVGRVAVVEPGTGQLALPDEADAVMIDVRSLPAGQAAADAVIRATGLALQTGMSFTSRTRLLQGFPEQLQPGATSRVSSATTTLAIPATGSRALPLAFVTPAQLGPRIATIIGYLRLAQRAWLLGHDIHAAVAESQWSPVGDLHGLLWPGAVHDHPQSTGIPWPDRIPADVASSEPDELFARLVEVGAPPAIGIGGVTRSRFITRGAGPPPPAIADGRGVRRAMLLTAHGTLIGFDPYAVAVSAELEQAFLTGLDELAGLPLDDRQGVGHALGRYLHQARDGHGQITDLDGSDPAGYFDVQIELIDGMAVIRSSPHVGVQPGDAIIAIDGVPATQWFADVMARKSAASEHHRFDKAVRELQRMSGPLRLTLRDPDGLEREQSVEPVAALTTPRGGSERRTGWLTGTGVDDVLYINLNRRVTEDPAQLDIIVPQLISARAAIIDIRDEVAIDPAIMARYLRTRIFAGPVAEVMHRLGSGASTWQRSALEYQPEPTALSGPIAVLLGHQSILQAEELLLMLADAPNVTLVGRPSASVAGPGAAAALPGGYLMSFSDARVYYPDGSDFHGVGLVPDIAIDPTPAQLRDGRDPALEAGLAVVSE